MEKKDHAAKNNDSEYSDLASNDSNNSNIEELLELNAEESDKDDVDDSEDTEDARNADSTKDEKVAQDPVAQVPIDDHTQEMEEDSEMVMQLVMKDDDAYNEDEDIPPEVPKAPEQAEPSTSPPKPEEQQRPEHEPECEPEVKAAEPPKPEPVDPLKAVDNYETVARFEGRQKLDLDFAWEKSPEFKTSRMQYEFRNEINEKLSAAGKGKPSGPFTCVAVSLGSDE